MKSILVKFTSLIDFIMVAFLVAVAMIVFIPGMKAKARFFIAAVLLGTVSGFAASSVPVIADWSVPISVFGTITGPVTVLIMHKKSALEALSEITDTINKARDERKELEENDH